jgi:CheY-specific phosphatase CheX
MVDSKQLLVSRLREGSSEHFRALLLAALIVDKPTALPAGRQVASVLAFSGWQIRGSLTVRSTVSFFETTHPTATANSPLAQEAVADWAGEFTNQLLGRFKNKMLAYGLDFQVGIPVTIYGENLVEAGVATDTVASFQLRTSNHLVGLTLLGRLAAGVELFDEPSGKAAARPGVPIDL